MTPRPIVYLTSVPRIYKDVYHHSTGIAGLHYCALGLGLLGTSQLNSRTMDRVYSYLKKRNGDVGEPEMRIRKSRPSPFLEVFYNK